jgi:hypothetical protein
MYGCFGPRRDARLDLLNGCCQPVREQPAPDVLSGALGPCDRCLRLRLRLSLGLNAGLGDVAPGSVRLGAELPVDGGGYSMSTSAEVVGDRAERNQETLRMLG